MQDNSVGYDCHANMKETNTVCGGLGLEIQQIGQINTELNADIDKGLSFPKMSEGQTDDTSSKLQSHVLSTNTTTLNMIGPSTSKPKGTWTRINRMDFGLNGLTRAITLPGLGKRDPQELQDWQDEEQNIKKGKVSNDEGSNDYVSVGVEIHPCRKQ